MKLMASCQPQYHTADVDRRTHGAPLSLSWAIVGASLLGAIAAFVLLSGSSDNTQAMLYSPVRPALRTAVRTVVPVANLRVTSRPLGAANDDVKEDSQGANVEGQNQATGPLGWVSNKPRRSWLIALSAMWVMILGVFQKRPAEAKVPEVPPTDIQAKPTSAVIQLPPLPWGRNALEPHISAETIDYHYGKHHQAYVNKLNELLALPENAQWKGRPLEDIVAGSSGVMFNQAAQIWNHNFYWNGLKPNPQSQANAPTGAIKDLIDRDFGSFEAFKDQFTAAAVGHFGSGWIWLVQGADGKLKVTQGHDAGNPLKDGTGTPLLTCDVWEHAYYIDRRNARPAYVKAWWNVVNWDSVNQCLSI